MTGTFSSSPVFAVLIAATLASTDLSGSDFADEAMADRSAIAESGPVTLRQITADVLKHEYLKCDRAATEGRLDIASAARCSFVYEALRERVFDGDFDALLAWWRHTR